MANGNYNTGTSYQPYQIPTAQSLLGGLSPGQQELTGFTSGGDIARHYGYDPKKYGKYFTPLNLSEIGKGLSQLNPLKRLKYGAAREDIMFGQQGLLGEVGRTNLAHTGSFAPKFQKLQTGYDKTLFGIDQSIQDKVTQFKKLLGSGLSGIQQSLGQLLTSGAEETPSGSTADYSGTGEPDPNAYSNISHGDDYYDTATGNWYWYDSRGWFAPGVWKEGRKPSGEGYNIFTG